MPRRWFFCVSSVLLLTGCNSDSPKHNDFSKHDELLRGIRKLQLVDDPGITFEASSIAGTSGTTDRLAETTVAGELIATDNARLPADFAQSVLDKVRVHVMSGGGTLGEEGGRNLIQASASGVKNADLLSASFSFSQSGTYGKATVYVIERNYESKGKKIIGQLLVTVLETR